jgi:hypothetical protein
MRVHADEVEWAHEGRLKVMSIDKDGGAENSRVRRFDVHDTWRNNAGVQITIIVKENRGLMG